MTQASVLSTSAHRVSTARAVCDDRHRSGDRDRHNHHRQESARRIAAAKGRGNGGAKRRIGIVFTGDKSASQ